MADGQTTNIALPPTPEATQELQQLFNELAFALKQTKGSDLRQWGIMSASRFPKVGMRRLKNFERLAFRLSCFLRSEAALALAAWRQQQFSKHLATRTKEGIDSTFQTSMNAYKVIKTMAAALRDDPKKNAVEILAFSLGFFVGSGGIDGNGGLPDTDIAMFGIGGHRSILTHSIIAGMVAECSILALADLAGIVCDKVPKEGRSPFWDILTSSKDQIAHSLSIGASSGIAYHLAVDATIQPAPYKDLPISLPLWGHQSLFAANAIVEGNDTLQRHAPSVPVKANVNHFQLPPPPHSAD